MSRVQKDFDPDALFEMKHLDRISRISGPCTVYVRNNNAIDYNKLYTQDGHNRWIITLKAMTEENFQIVKEASKVSTIYYRDVRELFLTGAIWENQILSEKDMPLKGEEVGCVFDYRDGILRCVSVSTLPRKRPKTYIHSVEVYAEIEEFEKIILKDE